MEIRTKRLILREFATEDIPGVRAYHAHPDYHRYLPWEYATPTEATEFVARCIAEAAEPRRTSYQFAVTLHDGTLVGSTGFKINAQHRYEAQFACELDPKHWGRGYGSEMCHGMMAFGFGTLGLHRAYSHVIAENRAAVRMLLSVGMRREGLFRENRFFGGHWWDTLSYGIIARDWKPPLAEEPSNFPTSHPPFVGAPKQ